MTQPSSTPSPATASTKPEHRTGTLYWLPLILNDEELDPTETLLMVGLADHINAADECFVGIVHLARQARVSYGTARRRLAALEAKGRIIRDRKRRDDGNLSVYSYRFPRPPEPEVEPARNLRDDQRAPESAMTSAHPDARTEPPRIEPPRTTNHSCDDGFAAFWLAYPSKVAKGTAERAWPKAVKASGSEQAIVDGAARYRDDPNRSPAFTAHPATWLNGKRWEDPPLAARERPVGARTPEHISQDRGAPEGLVRL